MDQRRYSMKDVQRMIQLSPYILQDLLKRYPQHIQTQVVTGPEGEEIFMDQASFERLMFIKQLELNQQPTHDELITQLLDPSLLAKPGRPQEEDGMKVLQGSLDKLASEVTRLGDTLQQILSRYSHVLRDLNLCRSENRQLHKELEGLKARQNLIIGQINRDEPAADDDPKDKNSLN